MKIESFGSVDSEGKLKIHHRKIFDELLSRIKNKDVEIVVTVRRNKRSSLQNRYYFGAVIPCVQLGLYEVNGEWLGVDEVHEFLKQNFNYKEIINKSTGEVVRIAKTTTEHTTIEFEEYMDKIRIFADTFLNTIIPFPGEQSKLI